MEMRGEYRIPAPRERVWAALNDPEILKASIPGCQSLELHSPTEMTARVVAKIGPVKANFVGRVTLSDLEPPVRYTISGEGQGGVAGFAKGGADVSLADEDGETVLTYAARAQIGGKLAQLGARLIDSTAKSMADQFFARFSELAAGRPAEGMSLATATVDERPAPVVEPLGGVLYPASDIPVSQATELAREDAAGPSGDPLAVRKPMEPMSSATPTEPFVSVDPAVMTRTETSAVPSDRTDVVSNGPSASEERASVHAAMAPAAAEVTSATTAGYDTGVSEAAPSPLPKREVPRWVWVAGAIALVLFVAAALD